MRIYDKPLLRLLTLSVAVALVSGCGGDSGNDVTDPIDDSGDEEQQTEITSMQIDASSHDYPVYLNLETGELLSLTPEEAATSTAWHLAFQRSNIQLNSGASGPGNVVGAVAADQADFYTENGEPNPSAFLNATADSELEHLLADMAEPSRWSSDDVTSQFAEDWYVYDTRTGNMTANSQHGWLVRSAEGDSYARVQVVEFDFPTRTGEGIKAFEFDFDVQPAAQTNFTTTASFTGAIPSTGGERCFDFDSDATVGCDTSNWDIKLGFSGRNLYLRSNSGASGPGDGGVFGAFEWADLATYTSATVNNEGSDLTGLYRADTTSGIFTESSWYAYNLQDMHQLWPNYRVYLIDTNSTDEQAPIYALQVTGYYNDASTSGYPSIRWKPVELTTVN